MERFLIRKRKNEESPETTQKTQRTDKKLDSILQVLKLDLSTLKNPEDFRLKFEEMANFLLNRVHFMISGKKHRLLEIEFYFTGGAHQDPYTHCDKQQQKSASFYFHKTRGNYRTGNYKGLDITIGNNEKEVGGILIRSIEVLGFNPKIICGPSKTVDHILETCQASSIPQLVNEMLKGELSIESSDEILCLKLADENDLSLPHRTILSCPRVGLHMTKGSSLSLPQQIYLFKFYRFLTMPNKVWKGKHYMIMSMISQGKDKLTTVTNLGVTKNQYDKVAKSIEDGKNEKIDSFMNKKLTDDEMAKCFGCIINTLKIQITGNETG